MVGKDKQIDRKKPVKRLLDDFVIRNSSAMPQNQKQLTTADAVPIQMDMVEINSPTVLKPPSGDFTNDQAMLTTASIGTGNPTPSQRQFLSATASRPPTSASSDFFYSPMYRWYFSHTPPNPRLNNPRLLEDYIDWYMNIYLQEEHIFHSLDVGTLEERRRRDEQELQEEMQAGHTPSSTTATTDMS